LHNITSIGAELWIYDNDSLDNIEAFESINPGTIIDLHIYDNPQLSQCDISNICEYLLDPAGEVNIYGNASGCNSPEEVEEACLYIDIPEITATNKFNIAPNPFESTITIEIILEQNTPVTLQIFDLSGQVIETLTEQQQTGKHTMAMDLTRLKPGVYFCSVQTTNGIQTKKMIKL
jgi:hypothetical protein